MSKKKSKVAPRRSKKSASAATAVLEKANESPEFDPMAGLRLQADLIRQGIALEFGRQVPCPGYEADDHDFESCRQCDETHPLSARNAVALWDAMCMISMEIQIDLDAIGGSPITPANYESLVFFDQLPATTWRQGRLWREGLLDSVELLCRDLERGEFPVARCPAEEAILVLALRTAGDIYDDMAQIPGEKDLPHHPSDGDFDALTDYLMDDLDILFVLDPGELDGIEHPDDPINEMMGIGDYRPAAWFDRFSGRPPREADDEAA